MGVSDNARMAVLVVLTLIVIIAVIFFNHISRLREDEAAINPEEFVKTPRARQEPGAKVEFEKLASVRDTAIADRVIKEKEPYLHLIKQASRLVYGDMELLGVQTAVPEEIFKDTAAYRGKPFIIKGVLQWYEKITDLDFELYRGYLTSKEGDYFYFTVLYIDAEIRIGDVVKLQGFFFKRFSFTLPGEDERINNTVFLVGRRLFPSFCTMPSVKQLDFNLLDRLYDYDTQDMAKPFEEKQLYHMLSFVQNMDEETYRSTKFQEILAVDIIKAPREFRGKPVKILGEVVWLVKRNLGLEGENPVGPKTIYHGILLNYRGRFCYFLSYEKPMIQKKKDLIYAKGFFFRNYAYRSQNEDLVHATVLIVKGFEKFIIIKDNTFLYLSYIILSGTGVIFLLFFLHLYHDRKQNKLYREKFIARKKKLLNRMMEAQEKNGEPAGKPPLDRDDSPPQ